MNTLVFHNPTELDIRGACIMGLSAKDCDSPIGKFGTGLKYAIASILRWSGAIEIETGGEKYTFGKQPLDFRGKAHEQIIMTSSSGTQELGFTTHYGEHWEPWQIFRELYSNALDEGGGVFNSLTSPATDRAVIGDTSNEQTIIRVNCSKLTDAYAERDIIILPNPGQEGGPALRFYNSPSNYLYYRNVRVAKQRCVCTWNLSEGVDLTEDRTTLGLYPWEWQVGRFIAACTDKHLIRRVLEAPKGTFEHDHMSFSSWYDVSDEFLDIAEDCFRKNGQKSLPSGCFGLLAKHRARVDVPEEIALTAMQQRMLDRAVMLVGRMGMPTDNYPILICNLQKDVLGSYRDGKVLLSYQLFQQGTKQIVSTLYEELLHAETGLKDLTYQMQTHLFNTIVSLYEEHVFQEPC